MRVRLLILLLVVTPWIGCSSAPAPPPYKPVADTKVLMGSLLEPAADLYWDAVGSVVDAEGTHDFQPETPEEWAAVKHSAYVVAESGNLLMMPTRAKDSGEWMQFSRALIEAGERAIKAAESHNKNAVFDTGAEIYDACTACHAKYAVELQNRIAR